MRVFKNKSFARFARAAGLDDAALRRAARTAEEGRVDADLGGGVLKQRVARPGEGKSGGFRVIVLFRAGERAFFVYGFAKNERSDIRPDELTALRKLASEVLAYGDDQIARAVEAGALTEVPAEAAEQKAEQSSHEKAVPEQNAGGGA